MPVTATPTGSSRRSAANGTSYRSLSPSGRFSVSAAPSSASSSFAYSSSCFSSRSTTFFSQRAASPTSVNLNGQRQAHAVRFSFDSRPISPNRSISAVGTPQRHHRHHHQVVKRQNNPPKRTCMCSPTTHPGSFRCSLHKNTNNTSANYSPSNRLNARRSAMTNSLVRIGGVEGDLVRRALSALIRPSSHQQRRRSAFQPRPSRLSRMSKAAEW